MIIDLLEMLVLGKVLVLDKVLLAVEVDKLLGQERIPCEVLAPAAGSRTATRASGAKTTTSTAATSDGGGTTFGFAPAPGGYVYIYIYMLFYLLANGLT